jgi:hypothetical protein
MRFSEVMVKMSAVEVPAIDGWFQNVSKPMILS